MNSEIYETAAWRNFGMLDADETASFDEAMRLDPALKLAHSEVECLTAAMAAVMVAPVAPRVGQLEQLHLRLGLTAPKSTNWLAISGWATAAGLMLFFLFNQKTPFANDTPGQALREARVAITPAGTAPGVAHYSQDDLSRIQSIGPKKEVAPPTQAATAEVPAVKLETQRLTQEVETLRGRLEYAQERDRKRFEGVPGLSRPVIMRMKPPGGVVNTLEVTIPEIEELPISTLIGDALARAVPADLESPVTLPPSPMAADFSAILIYDPALDNGTLVIAGTIPSNPETGPPQLWMRADGELPIYVGTLPEFNVPGAPSAFDFSFGIKSTLPQSFIMTTGSRGTPIPPSPENTLLEGPR
jgi:hypothetical protein